mmetsp:Transcript_33352/g.84956  ORF Transcript_33352/g.84956 Transcript_33352/m.84956 type:complete len:289 (+) Transcript_33352:121-987(+)
MKLSPRSPSKPLRNLAFFVRGFARFSLRFCCLSFMAPFTSSLRLSHCSLPFPRLLSMARCAFLSLLASSWTFSPRARLRAFCKARSFLNSSPLPSLSARRSLLASPSLLRSSARMRRILSPLRPTVASKGTWPTWLSKDRRPASGAALLAAAASSADLAVAGAARAGAGAPGFLPVPFSTWSFSCCRFLRSSLSSAILRSSFECNSSRELESELMTGFFSGFAPPRRCSLRLAALVIGSFASPGPAAPLPSPTFCAAAAAATICEVFMILFGSRPGRASITCGLSAAK